MHSDDERGLNGPIASISIGSNRYFDMKDKQHVLIYPYKKSFAVDTKRDLQKVSKYMNSDSLFKKYKSK